MRIKNSCWLLDIRYFVGNKIWLVVSFVDYSFRFYHKKWMGCKNRIMPKQHSGDLNFQDSDLQVQHLHSPPERDHNAEKVGVQLPGNKF